MDPWLQYQEERKREAEARALVDMEPWVPSRIAPYRLLKLTEYGDYKYVHWAIDGPEATESPTGYILVLGGDSLKVQLQARDIALALANARRHGQTEIRRQLLSTLGLD